ncbi:MAG: long-chain fatty acid--CoA ligase [Xanthomonadales bacterium]|nr:long-chain fatty acid--CoA ligase [Xanthomonadales bacterium]
MGFRLFDFLAKRAELGPDDIAFEDLPSGGQTTYFELHLRASRAAALLQKLGVGPGDRVGILCRNRVEFFELLFACARARAILVPLNWRMPAAELRPLLDDCGCRCLLHGSEDAATLRELALNDLVVLGLDDHGAEGYPVRRDRQQPEDAHHDWRSDEPWYLLYTSGTTGRPKAVIQTFGSALANYINISQGMGLRGGDASLNFLPLFHTGGINLTTLPGIIMGARALVMPGFDLDQVIELIAAGRLDTFFGVPAIYQAIALHPKFEELDLGRVRCWACGGAPMPDRLFTAFAERGAVVLNGMGMTETGPTAFLMDPAHAAEKIGSVGKPQLLTAVRLVDPEGRDVPPGDVGEIWFAGPGITPGYFGQAEATAEALVDGKWLRSGDLGRQDKDGYYYIVGRLKDMYISGGENVYAAEVENCLNGHPAILESAVVGVPDAQWGEVGFAHLLLRPGARMPDVQELVAYCRQHLAPYKVPRQFVRVEEFPRTAAGKIQKHLLDGSEGQ